MIKKVDRAAELWPKLLVTAISVDTSKNETSKIWAWFTCLTLSSSAVKKNNQRDPMGMPAGESLRVADLSWCPGEAELGTLLCFFPPLPSEG